jgi:hypothetical protein
MIDIGRAIQHPFEDRDWATKLLIGAGINLVPVLNFALWGYALDALRNTARREDVPLPTWQQLGDQFIEGLKLFVVQLVYSLPIIAVSLVATIGTAGFAVMADSGSYGSGTPEAFGLGLSAVWLCITCVALVYGLALGFITPALYIQLARTRSIAACFRLGEIWAMVQRNFADYALILVLGIGLGLAISVVFTVLAIIPFVGLCVIFLFIPVMILATPYVTVVAAHLYGQLAA